MFEKLKTVLVAIALFIGLFWVLSFLGGLTMGLMRLLLAPVLLISFIFLFIKIFGRYLKGKEKGAIPCPRPAPRDSAPEEDIIARRLRKISQMESRLAALESGMRNK